MEIAREVTKRLIDAKTDYGRVERLNRFLPGYRPPASIAVRDKFREEVKAVTQLAVAGGFGAIATLIALAQILDPSARPSLYPAAFCFALTGIASVISLVLGVAEPVFRASVAMRLEAPDEPMTNEEDYYFSEAVDDRLWNAPRIIRDAMVWRTVTWLKSGMLAFGAVAFCIGLFFAARALT